MLRPKLHSDPLMIPMREVSGRLSGCETRSTFQLRWITLQREAVVATAARMNPTDFTRSLGSTTCAVKGARQWYVYGRRRPGAQGMAHITRATRPSGCPPPCRFPLSTAEISPFPSFGVRPRKSTFPRPSLGKAQCANQPKQVRTQQRPASCVAPMHMYVLCND